jgi:hypothetical protein
MILRASTFALLSTSLLFAACGGDDDAPPCVGHGCPTGAFDLAEGGEIRIEYNTFADASMNVNLQGLFFRNQTPDKRPLAGAALGGGCEDWSAGNIFDNGTTMEAQLIADSREYIDIGASFKIAGNGKEWTLGKVTNDFDRTNFLTHDILYLDTTSGLYDGGDAATIRAEMVPDTKYTISGDGLPTLRDGVNPLGVQLPDVHLYLPQDFTTLTPAATSTGAGASPKMFFTAGMDSSWTWNAPSNPPEDTLVFIAFVNLDPMAGEVGAVTHQCLGEDTGSLNIPGSMISALPSYGLILQGRFAHHAYVFNAGNSAEEKLERLDLLAVNCHFFDFVKQ